MVYVARFSSNIEGDIKRGWSAYMGMDFASPAQWAKDLAVADEIAEREGAETIEDVADGDIVYWAEQLLSTDLRLDEQLNRWRVCHHDGLSCWLLESTDSENAIAEATEKQQSGAISWSGFGWMTAGGIELVKSIDLTDGAQLHILRCEDAYPEH